ncbi:hypothetical protein Cpir12675_005297 [Ceratocystis pirilliformis]|uniref:Uncharacterized protein n=1 Tax=Ceratocystis pirilliformis TaxID=259994 RepID=A0ABR3YQP9_9PEZI
MSGKNNLTQMRKKEAEYMRNQAERQTQGSAAIETPPPYTGFASDSTPSLMFNEASAFGVRFSSLPPAPALVPPPSHTPTTYFPRPSVSMNLFSVVLVPSVRTEMGPCYVSASTCASNLGGALASLDDITEQVEPAAPSIKGRRLEFIIEVGRVRKTFQWRERKSPSYPFRCGRHYVLLRRAADRPPDGAPPVMQDDPGSERDNTSSMLRESECEDMGVVAQWDTEAIRGTKLTTFKFVGTGSTGLLGPRWEVIAVLSGLHICIVQVDQSVAGTA